MAYTYIYIFNGKYMLVANGNKDSETTRERECGRKSKLKRIQCIICVWAGSIFAYINGDSKN